VQVVRSGLGQGLRRGEERVGELGRVGQRALRLWSSPVGHEPARDSDGDGDEGEEGGDDEGDDEADLGDAHLLVARVTRAHVRPRAGLPLDRQDRVRLN